MDTSPHTEIRAHLAQVKQCIRTGRSDLNKFLLNGGKVAEYLRRHSKLVDWALGVLWTHASLPSDAALLAVGGYGRGELFPYSDVDVLILLAGDPTLQTAERLERLVGQLWDSGLEVGHSVRNIPECLEEAKKDITDRSPNSGR